MRVATLLLVTTLTGCATIMAGGPDHVPVNSNPPGAAVYVDNMLVGQTPMVVTLNREHSAGVIRIEAPGYQPVTVVRAKGINGWFWANLCIGGLVGMVVDLVTGDVKAFDDTPIAIGMTPGSGYGPPAGRPGPAPGTPQQPRPDYAGAAAPPLPAHGY